MVDYDDIFSMVPRLIKYTCQDLVIVLASPSKYSGKGSR